MSRNSGTNNIASAAIREMFDTPKLALDRAPVLHGIFERLATVCGERMRSLCVPQCSFMLNAVTAGNTWDLIENYEDGICGIFYSPEWEARILIGADRRFTFSAAEGIFGGDGTEMPHESDRAFSTVETRTMRRIFEESASGLRSLIEVVDRIGLEFERMESKLDFSSIGVSDVPAVMAQFIVQIYDGGGRLFVIMPQAQLVPYRRNLERERVPEPPAHDPVWARSLLTEVGRAEVQLDAVLEGPTLAIGAVADLRPGQILHLAATRDSLLSLESMGEVMFRAKLGQADGMFTVLVDHPVDQQRDLFNEIVADARTNAWRS